MLKVQREKAALYSRASGHISSKQNKTHKTLWKLHKAIFDPRGPRNTKGVISVQVDLMLNVPLCC